MSAPRSDDFHLVRRLDWRFLLPDPRLRDVVYLGEPGGELHRALHRFVVGRLEDRPDEAEEARFDVAVVRSSRKEDVRKAWALIRPGGHVYWEVDRRRAPWGSAGYLRDPRGILRKLGASGARLHWHYPDLQKSRFILPPTGPAVSYAARRRSRPLAVLDRAVAALVPWLFLHRFLPTLSLVGRKPGGPDLPPGPAARAAISEVPDETAEERPYVLITPRFRESAHVITAFLDSRTGRPLAMAKTARLPGEPDSLDREAMALQAVASVVPDPDSVPRLLGMASLGERPPGDRPSTRTRAPGSTGGVGGAPEEDPSVSEEKGHSTLVESAVQGRLLTPEQVRAEPERWTEAVVEWITTLHLATRSPGDDEDHWRRWVAEPLARLQEAGPGTGDEDLFDRTRIITRPIVGMGLPSVLEHGDVACPNILVSESDRIGMVDWERTDVTGLPAGDLFFFLAFVAVARENAVRHHEAVEAFRGAFRGPDAWAIPFVADYWSRMSLPPEAAAPLFVACWARRGGRPSGRSRRYHRFWSEACSWAGEIELTPHHHIIE